MPITRRRRANPPEQPENNNNHLAENQAENSAEAVNPEQAAEAPQEAPEKESAQAPDTAQKPVEMENDYQPFAQSPMPPAVNGDRMGRPDYISTIESGRRTMRGELFRRPPQVPAVPPTPPAALQPPSHEIKLPLGTGPGDASGDPLHLAYNPGYTGADEVRSTLIHSLAAESKQGGRARCWNCGSLAITYECWNTRNRSFGEIGIAFCEICGVWSVL
jgi:hypothetical protein